MKCKTIVFERPAPTYSPCYKVVRVSKPKTFCIDASMKARLCASRNTLRNASDGSFAVYLDESVVYLKKLVKLAQKNGLTVSGDGSNRVSGGDITHARKGDIITFGTSTRFDVNWIRRNGYACERSIVPIHLVSNWETVKKAVKALAAEKKRLLNNTYYVGNEPNFKDLKSLARKSRPCGRRVMKLENCSGTKAYIHDDFVKVGWDFLPIEKKTCTDVVARYRICI